MKSFFIQLLPPLMVAGLFSRLRKRQEPDPDQLVLNQLRRAGSNLAKLHDLEFFLYFPTEEFAHAAAKEIEKESCSVEVKSGADGAAWLCFATRKMIPAHPELVRLRDRFNNVARQHQGEYDGWGTGVVK